MRDQHLRECRRILKPGGYLLLHNESSEEDVLVPGQEIVIQQIEEWSIPEHSNWFDLPDGGKVQVSFPGHMPPGLSGRRSVREHRQELKRAGFDVLRCHAQTMRPDTAIPGNRVIIAFAQRPS